MGLLKLHPRPAVLNLVRLPSGSFTVDPYGRILISTLPQAFPEEWVKQIAQLVLRTFREAEEAQIPLREINAEYSTLKLAARALRGGAIVFLSPKALGRK